MISIVIPVKDERETIAPLTAQLTEVLDQMGGDWEIIFVDDGSEDGSPEEIERICAGDGRIRALMLRRNFGKAVALQAGFDEARGGIIFTLDGDLQDDPQEIPRFLAEIEAGADLVSGWKRERRDPLSKRLLSRLFNAVVSAATGIRLHDFNCGFKCYRRAVIEEVQLYGELHRFIPALAHACGFHVREIPVTHHPRRAGKSKYGIGRLPKGFFDLLTVLMITRYLDRPLHFIGGAGLALFTAGFLILAYLSVLWFAGTGIGARPLFFLGILLVILGVQMITTGLVAEMTTRSTPRERTGHCVRRRINPTGSAGDQR